MIEETTKYFFIRKQLFKGIRIGFNKETRHKSSYEMTEMADYSINARCIFDLNDTVVIMILHSTDGNDD